jgi:DNA-binding LytR/AlgR family response regulator
LEEVSDVEIIGECSNGEEAIEMLSKIRPDLIFLDIEMPRINGMEFAQRLMEKANPYIVFVTAHEKYALDAFKVQAVDYVLKPINELKIREVMERVADRVRQRRRQEIDSRLDSIIQLIERQKKDLQPAGSLDRITRNFVYRLDSGGGKLCNVTCRSIKTFAAYQDESVRRTLKSKTFFPYPSLYNCEYPIDQRITVVLQWYVYDSTQRQY